MLDSSVVYYSDKNVGQFCSRLLRLKCWTVLLWINQINQIKMLDSSVVDYSD